MCLYMRKSPGFKVTITSGNNELFVYAKNLKGGQKDNPAMIKDNWLF